MRQNCDECGIYSVCNDDGICGDCAYELSELEQDECEVCGEPAVEGTQRCEDDL